MRQLIIRRIVVQVPVLLLMTIGVFSLVQLIPGNAAQTLAGDDATPEQVAALSAALGLDRNPVVQYLHWLGGLTHGDLGTSLITGQSVTDAIVQRAPVTVALVLTAAVVSLVLGAPIGVLSGLYPGSWFDRASRLVASLAAAIPAFWLAPLLIIPLAVHHDWLPSSGYVPLRESPSQFVTHLILPGVTLGFFLASNLLRQLRSSMIETLDSNYVRTAWSVGAPARVVVTKHGLKNAAIPGITAFGLQLGYLLGGTVIVEQIFGLPGIGQLVVNAVLTRDVPVIQGVTIFFAVTTLVMSLVIDIAPALLNPKLRMAYR